MTSTPPITVSDLTELIAAREETRAELRSLAILAYDHWLELEARIEQLELRLDRAQAAGASTDAEA